MPRNIHRAWHWSAGQTQKEQNHPSPRTPAFPDSILDSRASKEKSCPRITFDDTGMTSSKRSSARGLIRHFVILWKKMEKSRLRSSGLITTSVLRHFTVMDWSVCQTQGQQLPPLKQFPAPCLNTSSPCYRQDLHDKQALLVPTGPCAGWRQLFPGAS